MFTLFNLFYLPLNIFMSYLVVFGVEWHCVKHLNFIFIIHCQTVSHFVFSLLSLPTVYMSWYTVGITANEIAEQLIYGRCLYIITRNIHACDVTLSVYFVIMWIYTQSNIASIIFTWVHYTNTEKSWLEI
jgi:hypothetical protein